MGQDKPAKIEISAMQPIIYSGKGFQLLFWLPPVYHVSVSAISKELSYTKADLHWSKGVNAPIPDIVPYIYQKQLNLFWRHFQPTSKCRHRHRIDSIQKILL